MTDALELRLERLIPAPPDEVFDAWTKPEIMSLWWGPEGYQTPSPEIDLRQGGRFRTEMTAADGAKHIATGTYREIDRPRRLSFTWAWEANGATGHESEIIVTFDEAPGGTKLVFVQQRLENVSSRDGHRFGWESTFNRLVRLNTPEAISPCQPLK